MPAISVVLPVFNGGSYLEEAILSIRNQSFKDFEFIIINDGSTDRSLDVIRRHAYEDSRIIVIDRENKGLVATLNEGVAVAKGELIARMDADDVSSPERLERQHQFMISHSDCVCVGSDVEIIDDNGRKITVLHQLTLDVEIQNEALKGHTTICHPVAMFRRQAFIACGGYDPEMYPAEDLDLWLKLGEIGALANISEVLIRYRILPNSISGSAASDGRQRQAAKRASDRACIRRKLNGFRFEATLPWRPGTGKTESYLHLLNFGWLAYNSREYRTAISYGFNAGCQKLRYGAFILIVKSLFGLLGFRG